MVAQIIPSSLGPDFKSIVPTSIDKEELAFSFKYLQLDHSKFSISTQKVSYFKKFLERLLAIAKCSLTKLKRGDYGTTLRFHQINFTDDKVSENEFNALPRHLVEVASENAWQFSICANAHGRVHGFMIGNLFYCVWLDPDHKLYP